MAISRERYAKVDNKLWRAACAKSRASVAHVEELRRMLAPSLPRQRLPRPASLYDDAP